MPVDVRSCMETADLFSETRRSCKIVYICSVRRQRSLKHTFVPTKFKDKGERTFSVGLTSPLNFSDFRAREGSSDIFSFPLWAARAPAASLGPVQSAQSGTHWVAVRSCGPCSLPPQAPAHRFVFHFFSLPWFSFFTSHMPGPQSQ